MQGSILVSILSATLICCVNTAVHDDLGQCGLKGIYKTRQSILTSPNYPNQYAANSCWDYVVRSPYRCPTKFHIQFLDFMLESSKNCTHDYLAIGINVDDDDMDILCGQVMGIKKYYTPDGVLRLRFYADNSPWTRGKGFKLLVTRLACEQPDILRDLQDDTESVVVPPALGSLLADKQLSLLQNLSLNEQYETFDAAPVAQIPNGAFTGLPWNQPNGCTPSQTERNKLADNTLAPNLAEQWQLVPLSKSAPEELIRQQSSIGVLPQTESCCFSSFSEERFYLSSPGFPRTVLTSLLPTQQRDCSFQLEKYNQNVCRVRIVFKYFDFGQPYVSTILGQPAAGVPLGASSDACSGDFVEIDGLRFCGCRSGFITTIRWDTNIKLIRMRMGYSGISSNGFLLELIQEQCQLLPSDNVVNNGVSNLGGQAILADAIPQQPQNSIIGRFPQRPLVYPMAVNYQPLAYNPYMNPFYPRVIFPQAGIAGYPQYRQSRSSNNYNEDSVNQPAAVVETNSTRKEFYYYDDEHTKEKAKAERRIDDDEEVDTNKKSERIALTSRNRCVFSTSDIFKLLIDPLWIRKQICISPQRRLLGTLFG